MGGGQGFRAVNAGIEGDARDEQVPLRGEATHREVPGSAGKARVAVGSGDGGFANDAVLRAVKKNMPMKEIQITRVGFKRIDLAGGSRAQAGQKRIDADVGANIVDNGPGENRGGESCQARRFVGTSPAGVGCGAGDPFLSAERATQDAELRVWRNEGKREPKNFAQEGAGGKHSVGSS
jgi:hypothetical protein